MEALTTEQIEEEMQEQVNSIDFKMVTFSLGGKEYGIDIMKVKEISKARKFTFVPNSVPFVRGVYNLRGEIISIIDLRIMFHLPALSKRAGEQENIIILRLEDNILGIIVDTIEKVVGVSSESIQPPHPLFGDINIKYIEGVVEKYEKLYLILDAERIFGKQEEAAVEETPRALASQPVEPEAELDYTFIMETLATFRKFFVSPVNRDWVHQRFEEWKKIRPRSDLQLKDPVEADEFLSVFFSRDSGCFWKADLRKAVASILSDRDQGNFNVWNVGCGQGYEAYSIATLLKEKYPLLSIKLWANDNDLLSISTAPNLVFGEGMIPEDYTDWIVEGKNGFSFSPEIRDMLLFEFHDILHPNPFPPVDLIVARDLLSFLTPDEQALVLTEFEEKLKEEGILIVGEHENLPADGWTAVGEGNISAYKKYRR
ncbi:MAG: chemotaxis protein CheW [Spirochaetales bacterium]|nr:chemotaxis protein CheW [Spirochaetales bacterium]